MISARAMSPTAVMQSSSVGTIAASENRMELNRTQTKMTISTALRRIETTACAANVAAIAALNVWALTKVVGRESASRTSRHSTSRTSLVHRCSSPK